MTAKEKVQKATLIILALLGLAAFGFLAFAEDWSNLFSFTASLFDSIDKMAIATVAAIGSLGKDLVELISLTFFFWLSVWRPMDQLAQRLDGLADRVRVLEEQEKRL